MVRVKHDICENKLTSTEISWKITKTE